MKLLTIEQILQFHALIVVKTGGSDGIRDIGRLASAIESQTQQLFGHDVYEMIYDKSAALMRGIICDHPFVDGNKRTGMLAGLTLLAINKCEVNFVEKEIEDFAVEIVTKNHDVARISEWLKAHCNSLG